MATKKELIAQIQNLAQVYVGFTDFHLSGLNGRSKADLEARAGRLAHMVALHQEGVALARQYTDEQRLAIVLGFAPYPDDFQRAIDLQKQARDIWLGGN